MRPSANHDASSSGVASSGGDLDGVEDLGGAAAVVAQRLRQAGVVAVLLAFVDNAGVTRARAVPLQRFVHAALAGVGLSTAWHVVSATDRVTSSPHIGNPAGDLRLVADAASAVLLPERPGWAFCPVDQQWQDGRPHDCCARDFLRRGVERLEAIGLSIRAGHELEWWLAAETERGPLAVHDGPAVGANVLVRLGDYARDLIVAGGADAIGLEALNAEYSNGQLEVALSAKDPISAVDGAVLARLVIHALSARYGWRASFSPAFAGPMGNGGHVHVSLWRGADNLFAGGAGPAGMQPEAASFLAGVLGELDAITAVGAPTVASYLRLKPSRWAGAYRCWGIENREAALRVVQAGAVGQAAANVEVKAFDEAANPYLLLGALLHAGAAGIEAGLRLPPPCAGDPAKASPAELASSGAGRLPGSLDEAVAAMERSSVLYDSMGPALFDSYLAVRREEWGAFGEADEQAVIDAYLFRF